MSSQHKLETSVQLTGGQLFFEAARRYGLSHVFCNPGTTEVNFVDALAQAAGMEYFLCLHEDVATGAAAGFARFAGRPALVNLHLAPGLAHGLANLHNAKRARVPVIVTVGDHHTRFGLEESPLAGDIAGLARSLCKWSYSVRVVEEIPAALHRAMLQALTPPCGPVCLILPNDVLGRAVPAPLTIPELHIPQPGPANPASIAEAARLLQNAKKPLILIGDLFTTAGLAAVAEIARRTGAALWRDFFPGFFNPASDPLTEQASNKMPYLGSERQQILRQADCVLLAGVSNFTSFFLYQDDLVIELIDPQTPVIHIDSDVAELGKNAKGALPLLGDVDLTVQLLNQALADAGLELPPPFNSTNRARSHAFVADDNQPLTPEVLGRALRQSVPPGVLYVDESITSGAGIWAEFVDGNKQIAQIMTGRGGSLGYGIPAAIGAQLALPGQPTLAIIGDGTAIYSIQALWSLARYNLPVVTIICKNRNYDIITLELLRVKGALAAAGLSRIHEYTSLTSPDVDFVALAQGFGVQGQRVSKPSQLPGAIEAAFASGKPALIEVLLTGSPLSPVSGR